MRLHSADYAVARLPPVRPSVRLYYVKTSNAGVQKRSVSTYISLYVENDTR